MHRHRQTILAMLSLAAGIAASESGRAWAEEQDNCGHSGITVAYEHPAELDMACRALTDVIEYFRGIGFKAALEGSLRFADRPADRSAVHASGHGYFDPTRSYIVVYRLSDVSPWRLPWTPQLAGSFLRHELAHMAIWEIVDRDRSRLRREWHEFIAYVVQLDLMEPQLRKDVLAAQAQVWPFENLVEVNEFTSRMDPDAFAVAAYKTYLARGSRTFVAKLLRAEIVPPPFYYPFPVLPGQVPSR